MRGSFFYGKPLRGKNMPKNTTKPENIRGKLINIFRDLTPMCVLLQSKEIKAPVKIGRFGLAIQCNDGQTVQVK